KLFGYASFMPSRVPIRQIVEFPLAFFIVFGVVAVVITFNARRSIRILKTHPAMLIFLVGTMAASFVGSFDSERCQPYAAVPVLYLFASIVQQQWHFFRQWSVAAPLLIMQTYLSDFFRLNMADYLAYMSHGMPPHEALAWVLNIWAAALLLATLRYACKP